MKYKYFVALLNIVLRSHFTCYVVYLDIVGMIYNKVIHIHKEAVRKPLTITKKYIMK